MRGLRMTQYYTAKKAGRIFVHSVWRGSWFVAVQFWDNRKVVPFVPFIGDRFSSYEAASDALEDYAKTHRLEAI